MIPSEATLLRIDKRTAQVVGGGLGTETHGEQKKTYLDLRLQVLIEEPEINLLLDPDDEAEPPPYLTIFNRETKEKRLPLIEMEGSLRHMRGTLTLGGLGDPMVFEDAHTVGSANRLTFLTGGHGVLALNMRVDAGRKFHKVVELIERRECTIEFQENEQEDAPPKPPKDQGEMPL